jgi:hypothetical protein
MGNDPRRLPALEQMALEVLPTRTRYRFAGAGIELVLQFMNPALPHNVDYLSRPVTYVSWEIRAIDGQTHDVSFYFDAGAELTVNEPSQSVVWSRETMGDVLALKVGSKDQPILVRRGDDVRIDWGFLYVAAEGAAIDSSTVASGAGCRQAFQSKGDLPAVDTRQPRPANDDSPVAAIVFKAGEIDATARRQTLVLAYDDLYSIQYMRQNLRPYWRRSGWEAADLLQASFREMAELMQSCEAFDRELMADLARVGGDRYARLCAMAYRQCFAASKFVADAHGRPLSFSKENFSNGCIATSDVFYPMSPQFLLFGPTLAKSFLVPFMNYAASERWRFPFAPHDLGTYPKANGQVYGGGERTEENQMPVEESANLLILMAAVAQMEGHAEFAALYWPQLERWAAYLRQKGFDPENQLCTDDFAGHLAHNVNLSAKAICGLGAFAKLCALRGDSARAAEYSRVATEFAAEWMSRADDGDHYRLAFDQAGTWSQKYNLVWDRVLNLGLFPESVMRGEMDFYLKNQNRYGLPLDNRKDYTKLDWILWTATLTRKDADFGALLDPVYLWLNETPDRVPMSDWYNTTDGRKMGFQARPVVGGVFLRMLYDRDLWSKYALRDQTRASGWAPMPEPPRISVVVPAAIEAEVAWRYTTRRPGDTWHKSDFDDSAWKEGFGGFGTRGTPGAVVRSDWNTSDIWMRRVFELPVSIELPKLQWLIHHDEDVILYLNGQRVLELRGYTTDYDTVPLSGDAAAALRTGRNIMAIHCRQTGGGQYVDVGLVTVE